MQLRERALIQVEDQADPQFAALLYERGYRDAALRAKAILGQVMCGDKGSVLVRSRNGGTIVARKILVEFLDLIEEDLK